MNPIEEMMEKLKIEKRTICEWVCKEPDYCDCECPYYDDNPKEKVFPPFIPEKQLKA